MDDQMKTPSLNGNIAPTPLCGEHLQPISSFQNYQEIFKSSDGLYLVFCCRCRCCRQ